MAHEQHYILRKRNNHAYNTVDDRIVEGWASAVEYYVTKLEYAGYGKDIDGHCTYNQIEYVTPKYDYNKQHWPYANESSSVKKYSEYSPLIIDLVDDNNQRNYYKAKNVTGKPFSDFPQDEVKGFELKYIQQYALPDSKTMSQFKSSIKDINTRFYSTINTSAQIDLLFQKYE